MASKSLTQATIVGVRWLALTRVLSEVIALGAAVVLARLVSPADFGRAAVALVFVQLGVMLTFEGFASALVQRKSVDQRDRGAAFMMSIVGGGVLSLVVFGLSGPLWRPLFGARIADLIALVSPVVLISALGGVSRATVWRSLDFRRSSLIDLVSLVVASLVSVALAVGGLGARAIVLGGLAQAGCTSLLFILVAPPPLPRWSGDVQRQIAGFGVPAALAALVDTLYRNIDYAILAARLPATQAGYYYRAFNLGVVYQDKLSRVLGQIAFPLYSRTKDHSELRQLHERAVRVNAMVIFPLLALLIALAPVAVPFVFGAAWRPAVEPTQILAVAGMIATVLTGYPQIMLAIGRPRPLLYFNIAMVAAYGGVVVLASSHGLVVVALAVVGVHLAVLGGVYHLLLRRYLDITIGRLIPELGPAAAGCVALLAVCVPLTQLLSGSFPSFLTLGLVGIAGLAVYAVVLRVAFPAACADLRLLVARVLPVDSIRRGRSRKLPTVKAVG